MSDRRDYLVHTTRSDPDLAVVCEAVFDAVEDRVDRLLVDAFSDVADRMPADIRTVEAWLRQRCAEQDPHGAATAVVVRPGDSPGWPFARAYTPWSVHVECFDGAQRTVAAFHDCGHSIIVSLDTAEADRLAAALPPAHAIEPLLPAAERDGNTAAPRTRGRLRSVLRRGAGGPVSR